jgi:hypothetical protein
MRSSEHFLASVPVVALVLVSLGEQYDRVRLAFLGVYGLALGVGIDFDHFLLARLYAGDWRHLRYLLRNPIAAVTEQEAIFEDVRDMTLQRLLSHVLLSGALIGSTKRVSGSLGFTTAVVLYWHLLCDLLRDNQLV